MTLTRFIFAHQRVLFKWNKKTAKSIKKTCLNSQKHDEGYFFSLVNICVFSVTKILLNLVFLWPKLQSSQLSAGMYSQLV